MQKLSRSEWILHCKRHVRPILQWIFSQDSYIMCTWKHSVTNTNLQNIYLINQKVSKMGKNFTVAMFFVLLCVATATAQRYNGITQEASNTTQNWFGKYCTDSYHESWIFYARGSSYYHQWWWIKYFVQTINFTNRITHNLSAVGTSIWKLVLQFKGLTFLVLCSDCAYTL